jgi:hypothetical protein
MGVLSFAWGQENDKALERDIAPLLEQLKSPNAGEREAAVREFMALREAISDALQEIVSARDSGRGTDHGKGAALALMGELRLAQCADIIALQKEKGWRPRPVATFGRAALWQHSVGYNLSSTRLASGVALRPRGPAARLAAYPALKGAVDALGAPDTSTHDIRLHTGAVWQWYLTVVSDALSSILSTDAYSSDVKVAAIWLTGEYRLRGEALLGLMDIRDEKRVIERYPARLTVTGLGPDAEYPAAVALLKAGAPSADSAISYIVLRDMSQSARERVARLLMLTDPEGARKALAEKTETYTSEKDQAVLRSLGDIIR